MFFRSLCILLSISFVLPPVLAQDIYNSRGNRQDIPDPRGYRQQQRRDFRNLDERMKWIRQKQQERPDTGIRLEQQATDQTDNKRRHEAFMRNYYYKLKAIKELREQPAGGLADVQLRNLLREQIWDVYSGLQSLIHILSGPLSGVSSIHAMDSATLNGRVDDLIWLTEKDPNSAPVLAKVKAARKEAIFALRAIKSNNVKQFRLHARLGNGFLDKASVVLKALLPIFQAAMNSITLRPGIVKRGNPKKYQVQIETEDTKTQKKKPPPKRVTFEPAAMYLLFWSWLTKIEQEAKDPKPFSCPAKNTKARKTWTLSFHKPSEKAVPPGVDSEHWRAVYFSFYPEFLEHQKHIQVHHAVERNRLAKNPGLFTSHEVLLDIRNLRGICGRPEAVAAFHQGWIRRAWNRFDRYNRENNIRVTRMRVMKFARVIDDKWGHFFYPYQNKALEPRLP